MKQFYINNTSGKGNTKEYIILHHTATGYNTVNGVINAFMGARSVSAHYIIDTNGAVYKFNTDDDILRHAGESYRERKTKLNNYSIGIEFIGPLPGFTDEQRNAGRKLITELMQNHNIPNTSILRHKDIAPTRKVDIDDSFWNEVFDSFEEYQKSFLNTKKYTMPEYTKKAGIKTVSNLCSSVSDSISVIQDEIKQKDLKEQILKFKQVAQETKAMMRNKISYIDQNT